MTLVWLAFALAVILAGLVFAMWTVRIHVVKSNRLIWLNGQRIKADIEGAGDDRKSRAAWATTRDAEYQRAMSITLQRASDVAVDRLVDILDGVQKLEVVA